MFHTRYIHPKINLAMFKVQLTLLSTLLNAMIAGQHIAHARCSLLSCRGAEVHVDRCILVGRRWPHTRHHDYLRAAPFAMPTARHADAAQTHLRSGAGFAATQSANSTHWIFVYMSLQTSRQRCANCMISRLASRKAVAGNGRPGTVTDYSLPYMSGNAHYTMKGKTILPSKDFTHLRKVGRTWYRQPGCSPATCSSRARPGAEALTGCCPGSVRQVTSTSWLAASACECRCSNGSHATISAARCKSSPGLWSAACVVLINLLLCWRQYLSCFKDRISEPPYRSTSKVK